MLKHEYILKLLKQLPFLLVLCALLSQPIIQTYSILSDSTHEFVDYDFEDDTEEEIEDSSEENEKVTPDSNYFILADADLSLYNSHFYVQRSNLSHPLEILIPPPQIT